MRLRRIGLLTAVLVAVTTGRAAAQQIPWEDRVFANISFGVQTGSESLSRSWSFTIFDEPASATASREVKGGSLFDIVVGGKVRRSFGAALAYTVRSKDSGGTVDATIPDPIVFESPRTESRSLADLRHRETWIAPMAVWFQPIGEKLDLMVMAGPAFVRVENEQADVTITDAGGGTLNVSTAVTKKSGGGFALGADVRYLVLKNIGAGGFIRIVKSSVDLVDNQKLDVGGLQAGIGLRIRY